MVLFDKMVMLICLFGGFFWLRKRARAVNLENQIERSMLGVFVLLPAFLIGEKYLFEHYHFGKYTDLLLKVLMASLTFPAIGYGFLKPGEPAEEQANPQTGTPVPAGTGVPGAETGPSRTPPAT